MMHNKTFVLLILGLLLFSLAFVSASKIDKNNTQEITGKYKDKTVIKFDGEYLDGVKQKDKSLSDVYIDFFEYKGKNKIYHVDSKKAGLINATLEFYYDQQPDFIQHIQHSGNLERTYFPQDWTWTPDGETGKGWVTLDVQNIDEGQGSNTFPIGTTGPQWANDGYFAGSFDGTAKVNVGTSALIDLGSGNWTYSLWMNPTLQTRNYSRLFEKGGYGANGTSIQLSSTTNYQVSMYYGNSVGWAGSLFATMNYDLNVWNYFVWSYDGTKINYYKNGILQGYTTPPSYLATSNAFIIGATSTTSSAFKGLIDKFQSFNRSLSQSEITQLYQNGLTSPVCNLITNGQVLCIDFDDFSVADKSGNGNNGVPTNLSYVEVQANKRTLVQGVDYVLDKSSGVLTLSSSYLYSWIEAEWDYNYRTTQRNYTVANIIGIFVVLCILGFIFLIINYYVKEIRN